MKTTLYAREIEVLKALRWRGMGSLVVYSARSPSKTTDNEDSALTARLNKGRAILAVADGVGGQPDGDQASAAALEAVAETGVEQIKAGNSLAGSLITGLDRANESVLALGNGSATTLAAVTIEKGLVRAFHVGDSGVLVFDSKGELKLETMPHAPVAYGVAAGLIGPDEAMTHADRHFVSNVVGDEDMHTTFSTTYELQPDDVVLIASDGLFDNVPVPEIVTSLRKGDLRGSIKKLTARCRETMTTGGHPDDLTLVAFRVGEPSSA